MRRGSGSIRPWSWSIFRGSIEEEDSQSSWENAALVPGKESSSCLGQTVIQKWSLDFESVRSLERWKLGINLNRSIFLTPRPHFCGWWVWMGPGCGTLEGPASLGEIERFPGTEPELLFWFFNFLVLGPHLTLRIYLLFGGTIWDVRGWNWVGCTQDMLSTLLYYHSGPSSVFQ